MLSTKGAREGRTRNGDSELEGARPGATQQPERGRDSERKGEEGALCTSSALEGLGGWSYNTKLPIAKLFTSKRKNLFVKPCETGKFVWKLQTLLNSPNNNQKIHETYNCKTLLKPRAEVRHSFITTTVRDESQVTPQGSHR